MYSSGYPTHSEEENEDDAGEENDVETSEEETERPNLKGEKGKVAATDDMKKPVFVDAKASHTGPCKRSCKRTCSCWQRSLILDTIGKGSHGKQRSDSSSGYMQVRPPCSWRAPYLNIRNVTRDVRRDVMSNISRNVSTDVSTDVVES